VCVCVCGLSVRRIPYAGWFVITYVCECLCGLSVHRIPCAVWCVYVCVCACVCVWSRVCVCASKGNQGQTFIGRKPSQSLTLGAAEPRTAFKLQETTVN